MDTALHQKFPFILDRNLAKSNCTENRVCTSCNIVVLGCGKKNIFLKYPFLSCDVVLAFAWNVHAFIKWQHNSYTMHIYGTRLKLYGAHTRAVYHAHELFNCLWVSLRAYEHNRYTPKRKLACAVASKISVTPKRCHINCSTL